MKHNYFLLLLSFFVFVACGSCKKDSFTANVSSSNITTTAQALQSASNASYDIVVYGGTSAGVIAAIEGAKMGKTVALISPTSRIGGMTTGGLSNTDINNINTLGGLTGDFYKQVQATEGGSGYALEPKVALQIFQQALAKTNVQVYYKERLLLQGGVNKTGTDISSIVLESGKVIKGKMFIDASYEGDLMAKANVSYTVGREAKAKYNEPDGGFIGGGDLKVDPYIVAGNPSSGLLPRIGVRTSPLGLGSGDGYTQAYNYRLCVTNNAANRAMITKPADFDSLQYVLLFRLLAANPSASCFGLNQLPNNKFDLNNNGNFSIDFVGGNTAYADADYATREQIEKKHESYERGLIWILQNDSRVPAAIRSKIADYGLAKDEFTENNNWPTQLYIREGRRMIGSMVMTEQNVLGQSPVTDPIALGSYNIDSHGVEYYTWKTNTTYIGGQLFVSVPVPYGISYKSIIPLKSECTNLLVPVCMSASHVAYGSIRMEPQYMIMAQSAATAAALAIDNKTTVQDLDYAKLKAQLLLDSQKLQ